MIRITLQRRGYADDVRRASNGCPRCGATVSQFAAGCFLLALVAFITPLVHGLPRMAPALHGR